MRNNIAYRILLLFVVILLTGFAKAQTTIWSEDWSSAKNGAYPESVNKMYYAGMFTSCIKANGSTYAGGKLPELMLVQGDKFTVTLTDLKGCYGDLTLSFKSNRDAKDSPRLEVTANGKAVEIVSDGKNRSGVVHVDEGIERLVLTFTAYGSNARIDDLSLVSNGATKQVSTLSFGAKADNHTFVVYKGKEGDFLSQRATLSTSASDTIVSYQSSNDNVVTVNTQGDVAFVGLGEATVTASYAGTDEVTASRASYAIKYMESTTTPIVFSSSKNSFKNAPADKKSSVTSADFISEEGKSYTFKIREAMLTKTKCLNCATRNDNTNGMVRSSIFGFPNGYDVKVVYGQISVNTTESYKILNLSSENGGTSMGKQSGTDNQTKGTGGIATLSVPSDESFEILPGNAATISNITITPHVTEKMETTLSFPSEAYEVTLSNASTFDAPQAKLTTTEGDGVDTENEIIYTITGSSSISIDSITGKLTFGNNLNVDDKVVVSANYPGDDTYAASSASYSLTVVSEEQVLLTFDEVDNISDLIDENYEKVVDVVLKRSISKDYLNTICLPFAMDAEHIAAAFGEGSTVSSYDGMSDGQLVFSSVQSMEAGVPYIIKATETKNEITIKNVSIEVKFPVDVQKTKDGKTYSFYGSFDPYTFTADDGYQLFLAKDGQLKIPTKNGMMKGMRAYFDRQGEVTTNSVNLLIDGQATAIKSLVSCENTSINDEIYNLNGERLNTSVFDNLPKGIYIKGNKKIIVK